MRVRLDAAALAAMSGPRTITGCEGPADAALALRQEQERPPRCPLRTSRGRGHSSLVLVRGLNAIRRAARRSVSSRSSLVANGRRGSAEHSWSSCTREAHLQAALALIR